MVEVDPDQCLFHLVYNPDPNLTLLRPNISLKDLLQTVTDHIILPEERPRFQALIYEEIPKFFQGGHHRQSYYFHVQSRVSDYPETYEVTLLRLDPSNLERRRMMLSGGKQKQGICRPPLHSKIRSSLRTPLTDRWLKPAVAATTPT